MAGDRIEAEFFHLLVAHAGEKIPAFVALPDMGAAKPVFVVHVVAVFWHAQFRGIVTARHRATSGFRIALRRIRTDTDVVTESRTVRCRTHDAYYGAQVLKDKKTKR